MQSTGQSGNAMSKINKHDHAECINVIANKDQTRIGNQTVHGLTLELVTHFFITIAICISMYYGSIFILELCHKYTN